MPPSTSRTKQKAKATAKKDMTNTLTTGAYNGAHSHLVVTLMSTSRSLATSKAKVAAPRKRAAKGKAPAEARAAMPMSTAQPSGVPSTAAAMIPPPNASGFKNMPAVASLVVPPPVVAYSAGTSTQAISHPVVLPSTVTNPARTYSAVVRQSAVACASRLRLPSNTI